MPQSGLLLMLVLPLQMLSGGATPRASMPELVQNIMPAAPTTHFVLLGQPILFRGALRDVIWPQFVALAVIRAALFTRWQASAAPSARQREEVLQFERSASSANLNAP